MHEPREAKNYQFPNTTCYFPNVFSSNTVHTFRKLAAFSLVSLVSCIAIAILQTLGY